MSKLMKVTTGLVTLASLAMLDDALLFYPKMESEVDDIVECSSPSCCEILHAWVCRTRSALHKSTLHFINLVAHLESPLRSSITARTQRARVAKSRSAPSTRPWPTVCLCKPPTSPGPFSLSSWCCTGLQECTALRETYIQL